MLETWGLPDRTGVFCCLQQHLISGRVKPGSSRGWRGSGAGPPGQGGGDSRACRLEQAGVKTPGPRTEVAHPSLAWPGTWGETAPRKWLLGSGHGSRGWRDHLADTYRPRLTHHLTHSFTKHFLPLPCASSSWRLLLGGLRGALGRPGMGQKSAEFSPGPPLLSDSAPSPPRLPRARGLSSVRPSHPYPRRASQSTGQGLGRGAVPQ